MRFYKFFFWFFRVLYHVLPVGFVLLLAWIISGRIDPTYLNTVYLGCVCLIILMPVCKLMADDIGRKRKLQRLGGGD